MFSSVLIRFSSSWYMTSFRNTLKNHRSLTGDDFSKIIFPTDGLVWFFPCKYITDIKVSFPFSNSSWFVVQLLGHIQLFATPWTAAHQASLSCTISQNLVKLMSIELLMPSKPLHPLSSPSPPAFNLSQHQGLFQWVGSLRQVAKVLRLQLQHQSFQWTFRVDLFRIDWFDLLVIQGTLKSLLQRRSSKASVLWCSAFFMVQLSHPYMITGLSGYNLNGVARLCFLIGSEVRPVHLIVLIVLWGNSALQWITACWSNY